MSPLVTALVVVAVVLGGVAVMAVSTVGAARHALNLKGGGRPQERFLTVSFCGIFIVVGLAFGGFSVRAAWRDGVSTAWPQVSGQIVRSTVKNDSSGDGDDYKPDIAYRYTVDGQEFTGTCVSFSGNHIACSYDFADRYVRRNPVGAAVRVSYQPGQPTVATLEPGLTRRSFSGVVMGLFFVVAGAYTIWHYENRERFLSLEGHPFLRMLPPFVGFGVFFGVIYWLSKS